MNVNEKKLQQALKRRDEHEADQKRLEEIKARNYANGQKALDEYLAHKRLAAAKKQTA